MSDPIKKSTARVDKNGKVIIGKRNFLSKVGWGTSKYAYMSDPYDRAENMRRVSYYIYII